MDYSKFSNDTLAKMAQGQEVDYSKLTDDELKEFAGSTKEEPSNDSSMQTLKDLITGAGDTLGISQQIGGAAQALPDIAMSAAHNIAPSMVSASPSQVGEELKEQGVTGDIGPTSSGEMYKQGTKDVQHEQEAALERSPVAYRVGEAGGLGLGAAGLGMAGRGLGAAAQALPGAEAVSQAGAAAGRAIEGMPVIPRVAAKAAISGIKAAPIGAAYGLAGSPGAVIAGTPEEQKQAEESAKAGAELGSLLGVGGSLIGQAGQNYLKNTEQGKRLATLFKMGKEGKDLSKPKTWTGDVENPESLQNAVSLHDTQVANKIVDKLNTADDALGQEVGNTIQSATDQGIIVKADPLLDKKMSHVLQGLDNVSVGEEGLEQGPTEDFELKGIQQFSELAKKLTTQGLAPSELQQLRNGLADYGRKIYMKDPDLAAKIWDISNNDLTGLLRENVPGYANSAERLNQFRRLLPEQILSKDNPQDITNLRISGIKNSDTKLLNNIKSMIRGLSDTSNPQAQGSFTQLLKGMSELQQNEAIKKSIGAIDKTVFDHMGIQPPQIQSYLQDQARISKVLQDYTGTSGIDLGSAISKPIGTVKQAAGYIANKAGAYSGSSAAKNPVLNTGTKLYSASDEALKSLSQKISQIPGQKEIGSALDKALAGKDQIAKNAVLFSIMQNPTLRGIVDSDNLPIEPGMP